jgi:hypothetical protein
MNPGVLSDYLAQTATSRATRTDLALGKAASSKAGANPVQGTRAAMLD